MRIIFCDDNVEILDQLQKYVCEFFKGLGGSMPDFAAYSSGDELLAKETYADIAFLDVEMPGRSGIHVGARLKELNPKIKIFIVTSYPDYLDGWHHCTSGRTNCLCRSYSTEIGHIYFGWCFPVSKRN